MEETDTPNTPPSGGQKESVGNHDEVLTEPARSRIVRTNSSPALFDSRKVTTDVRRVGKNEGCTSLSDITQLLFPNKDSPTNEQAHTAEQVIVPSQVQSEQSQRERDAGHPPKPTVENNTSEEEETKESKSKPAELAEPKDHNEYHQSNQKHGAGSKRSPAPTKIRKKCKDMDMPKGGSHGISSSPPTERVDDVPCQKRSLSCHERNPKSHRIGRRADHVQRSTFPAPKKCIGSPPLATIQSRGIEAKDLLAGFITYKDQLPPTPPVARAASRRHEPLPPPPLLPSSKCRKRLSLTPAAMQPGNKSSDVEMCSMQSSQPGLSRLHTPESQRPITLLKSPKLSAPCRSQTIGTQTYPRSILRLALDILRAVVILFSVTSLVARCIVAFGGKMSLLHYISNNPAICMVRWQIAALYVAFVLSELDLGVPFVFPQRALDNFLHRGFLMCFVGLLELCLSSNGSLDDVVGDLRGEGGLLSARVTRIKCAQAVLGINSRGMLACASIYFLLGLVGCNGGTQRRSGPRPRRYQRGLPKSPKRRPPSSVKQLFSV